MKTHFITTSCLLVLAISSCQEIQEKVDESDQIADVSMLASLHKRVLHPSCAVSGCHDGHFEPDFRTLTSSYYTTVFHPVSKNNLHQSFKYRAIPGDTANSVLYERITNCCFVNQDDRMPQDDIGTPMPDSSIALVSSWIMAGAPDLNGLIAQNPYAGE